MYDRSYSFLDRCFIAVDVGLRSMLLPSASASRPNPSQDVENESLSEQEKLISGRLMRVNHAGEMAAQGLYQGQALLARDASVRHKLEQAASEEMDHLNWCENRCTECDQPVSRLSPLWYGGSFAIGALASLAGDRWSLGFLAETEKQVVAHLQNHLHRLPPKDEKSKAILNQMCEDEGEHATNAMAAGATELPNSVKKLMRLCSKVMTNTAYWI